MARTPIHAEVSRTNIEIEKELFKQAKTRAKEFGGFGPYVERLLVADMRKKRSVAHRHGRFLEARR